MTFEYRRLLSEVWYANQMFWVLNLILQILSVVLLTQHDSKKNLPYIIVSSFNIAANLILVVLMLKTERRTLKNRRPEYNLLGDTPTKQRRALVDESSGVSNKGPYFRVKFKRQVVDNAYYTLQIATSDMNMNSYKITKQYPDFRRLQKIVEEVSKKQNTLFQNQAKILIPDSHYMMQRAQTFTVKAPVLEDLKQSFAVSQNDTKNLVALFDNLERFTDEITSNKLFWVPDVFAFFNVPPELSRQLSDEHEKHLKQVFQIDSRKSMTDQRAMSYSEDDIEEEIKQSTEKLKVEKNASSDSIHEWTDLEKG